MSVVEVDDSRAVRFVAKLNSVLLLLLLIKHYSMIVTVEFYVPELSDIF